MIYRLPQEIIDLLTRRFREGGKTWPQFNEDHKFWEQFDLMVRKGYLAEDDVPAEPDPSDYD
jgi:hypothetical protein